MRAVYQRVFLDPLYRLAAESSRVFPAVGSVILIAIVGGITAYLLRRVVHRLLTAAHFDRIIARTSLGRSIENSGLFQSPSDFGARMAQGMVWLVAILFALDAADTQVTRNLVVRFINYVPDLLIAVLMLAMGMVISKFLSRSALLAAVNAQWPAARIVAGGVRLLIMSLAVVIALEELQIGKMALIVSYAILFGGFVIPGSIGFGLAARDIARDWLRNQLKAQPVQYSDQLHHL